MVLRKPKGPDYTLYNSYRPIALLPVQAYVPESKSLLSAPQFNFRPNHSASDAVLDIVEFVKYSFQEKKVASVATLDIEGANNNVSHQLLVDRLY